MNSRIENLLKKAAETHSPPNETSSVANASRVYSTDNEVEIAFRNFKEKLFRVEYWNKASEFSSFAHYDENGSEISQKPFAVGTMIEISLPGSGKGDWVKIKDIYNGNEEIIITLQPSFDPTAEDKHTSHFFVSDSTNNFCLQKTERKLNFYVIGLNEKTNTEDTEGILETARNFMTSNVGYFFGIQKAQWKTFCENFLKDEQQ